MACLVQWLNGVELISKPTKIPGAEGGTVRKSLPAGQPLPAECGKSGRQEEKAAPSDIYPPEEYHRKTKIKTNDLGRHARIVPALPILNHGPRDMNVLSVPLTVLSFWARDILHRLSFTQLGLRASTAFPAEEAMCFERT